jgi:uncharacterized protein YciI
MNTNQYIYKLQPTRPEMLTQGPTDAESEALQGHVAYLTRLSEESAVLLAGRTQTTDESTFGLVILKAESESEARDIMKNDPAVKHGVMSAELFPYQISMLSSSIVADSK